MSTGGNELSGNEFNVLRECSNNKWRRFCCGHSIGGSSCEGTEHQGFRQV